MDDNGWIPVNTVPYAEDTMLHGEETNCAGPSSKLVASNSTTNEKLSLTTVVDNKEWPTKEAYQKENGCVINMKKIMSSNTDESNVVQKGDKEQEAEYDSDMSDAEDDTRDNYCARGVAHLRKCASYAIPSCLKRRLGLIVKVLLLVLYFVYFGFVMAFSFGDEGSIILLVCTVFGTIILTHKEVWRRLSYKFAGRNCISTDRRRVAGIMRVIRWALYLLSAGFMMVFLVVEVGLKKPQNLVSLGGLVFFILSAFFFSRSPAKVNWHTIYWGITLQFLLALFILRTQFGTSSVLWMTSRVNELLDNSKKASVFVFGKRYTDHSLIFGSLPCIFFINSLVGVLYYLGAIQWFVSVAGRFLRWTLDISAAESICVATNVLVDYPSAAVALKPYIELMSNSELFTVLIAGQSSVSGSFLGMISSFGISVSYLIPACVMSAPASIVISKLLYPANRTRKPTNKKYDISGKEKYTSIYEAASVSALSSMHVFASVAVSLYVYYGLLTFVSSILRWFGERVNISELTFEFICSYVFMPLPAIMGVDIADCGNIGKLIGYKIVGSTALSYYQLSTLVGNRKLFQDYILSTNGTGSYQQIGGNIMLNRWNRTLEFGYISERSEAIATYALCGLSNFTSIGIAIAVFYTIIPGKQKFIAKKIAQSMIWANVACFMTACLAGLFY